MRTRLAKTTAVAALALAALIATPAAFDAASSTGTVTVADGSLGWG